MTVLEAVERSRTTPGLSKGSIKAAQSMLSPSEEVIGALVTNIFLNPIHGKLPIRVLDFKNMVCGALVVTDQRLLFVNRVFLGGGVTKEIRLSDIRSIDSRAENFYECIRIVGTADMIVVDSNRDIIGDLRAAINEAVARKEAAAAPAPAQTSDIEQLQALKQLYDTGVLTAEEFAAKKAQILKL